MVIMGRCPDILVDHFNEVDFGEIEFPLITIYESPKDYPGKYVARLWALDRPTNAVIVKDTLDEVRQGILGRFDNVGRLPQDDPNIVEVWI